MWKFKASKFKNAAPRYPKKEEWISDISTTNLLQSHGNHIKASGAFMVFNIDNSGGSKLGILPIEHQGRAIPGQLPMIQAHSEFVTDFCFSPFDDYLLSTCSQDGEAKLWNLPDEITENVNNPTVIIAKEEKKIENVVWHPASDNILTLSTDKTIKLYDVEAQTVCYDMPVHEDVVQSFNWSQDGKLLITSCKDKKIRILDPRANGVVQEAIGHGNNRDSRVLWVSETNTLSSGFDMTRQREVIIKDSRNFSSSLRTLSLDTSTGILMPLYDPDTSMLFLAGKGDTSIHFMEVTEKSPYLNDGSTDTVEQIKGAALVPKRALDVMECEVNRVLLLSQNCVIPLPYHVPRKSYRDFHDDLFPDTLSGVPSMTASEWLSGENKLCTRITLNPSKGVTKKLHRDPSGKTAEDNRTSPTAWSLPKAQEVDAAELKQAKPAGLPTKPVIAPKAAAPASLPGSGDSPGVLRTERKPVKKFTGVRQSKFRHLQGAPMHKDLHFTNLKNVSRSLPGESNMFEANTKFCAVPLGGPGGLLAILKTAEPGRLPNTLTALQNRSMLMDFAFDPFDDCRVVTACDDAKLRIWNIPEDGFEGTLPDPESYLHGHTEKIYFVVFNPVARDLLASGSYDMTVRLWDLSTHDEILQMEGHTDTIFGFAWSPDGSFCATVCKDGKVRVYEPRQGGSPSQEGPGPEGTRGARLIWVLGGKYIIVSGFDKSSVRVISVYDSSNISKGPLHQQDLDTSPAILIPYYDEDSSTLLLTGRGDSVVRSFEVAEDYPHLFALADYKAENALQGLAVLPKYVCDVKRVEFLRVYQLTTNSVEPVSLTVPRVKMEYFQDDLYPDTRVTWQPLMTCSEWLSGVKAEPRYQSLKPQDITSLSDAPKEKPKESKYESFSEYEKHYKTDEQKKEELLSAMNAKLELTDEPLPQDLTEGVDDDEWDDY